MMSALTPLTNTGYRPYSKTTEQTAKTQSQEVFSLYAANSAQFSSASPSSLSSSSSSSQSKQASDTTFHATSLMSGQFQGALLNLAQNTDEKSTDVTEKEKTSPSDTTEDRFLKLARMSPVERYIAQRLDELGYTQEEFDALPQDEKDKIMKQIQEEIRRKFGGAAASENAAPKEAQATSSLLASSQKPPQG